MSGNANKNKNINKGQNNNMNNNINGNTNKNNNMNKDQNNNIKKNMSGNTKNSKNMNKTKTIAWRTWTITWTKTWTRTITITKTRTRTWTRTKKNNGNTNKNKKQDHEQEQNQRDTEHFCEVAGVSHSASGARSVEVTILCEGETLSFCKLCWPVESRIPQDVLGNMAHSSKEFEAGLQWNAMQWKWGYTMIYVPILGCVRLHACRRRLCL